MFKFIAIPCDNRLESLVLFSSSRISSLLSAKNVGTFESQRYILNKCPSVAACYDNIRIISLTLISAWLWLSDLTGDV